MDVYDERRVQDRITPASNNTGRIDLMTSLYPRSMVTAERGFRQPPAEAPNTAVKS
jgi:hypothetical protein